MNGFSLIEIMLALLILSVGLLGITGMQVWGLKYTNEVYYQSLASTQLSGMMDRLRANTSQAAREREAGRWNVLNARLLPQGKGEYTCSNNACTVRIQWVWEEVKNESLSGHL